MTCRQLVKKFLTFYGTWRFITAFTTARHLSISWAIWIQSMSRSHFSKIHFNIILHLRLSRPSGLLPLTFPTKALYAFLVSPIRTTCPAHLRLLDLTTRIIHLLIFPYLFYIIIYNLVFHASVNVSAALVYKSTSFFSLRLYILMLATNPCDYVVINVCNTFNHQTYQFRGPA
jgi:hypothetical protein